MKLGISLLIVAILTTIAYFQSYIAGYPSLYGGVTMWFIAIPCYFLGIKRIIRQRRAKHESQTH